MVQCLDYSPYPSKTKGQVNKGTALQSAVHVQPKLIAAYLTGFHNKHTTD